MLNWGAEQKYLGSNPIAGIKPLRHDHPKEGRPLTDEEVSRLLDRSPQPWRDIWYALLVTGAPKAELASLTFAEVDWENRELILRGGIAKNRRERRVPIEDHLFKILECQAREAPQRLPGKGKTPELTAQIQARLSREHVFVTSQNTPLTHRSGAYSAFMRSCGAAGIETKTYNPEGRLVEHVDLHSLRRTFATNAITNGADPKSIQELLGHQTLDMTMRIYAKVKAGPKRQALAKLTYGGGASQPGHLVQFRTASGGEPVHLRNRFYCH
jgi:integrase